MQNNGLVRAKLKTPRAAAIAGILFSILFVAAFSLLRMVLPSDPSDPGEWLKTNTRFVSFALNLIPFAGIVGALRDRLGEHEDRFFATVFLGSSLVFLTLLFSSAAAVGAIIFAFAADAGDPASSAAFHFARTLAYNIVNIYMTRMAAVFMISTSTVVILTGIAPRWVAFAGFGLGLLLLFVNSLLPWIFAGFPFWVFLISVCLLVDEHRRRPQASLASSG